jgi:hypothetical protein
MNTDLFGDVLPHPFGLTVHLVGRDNHHPSCGELATIEPGKAPHAAALRCVACGGFRKWMTKAEFDRIATEPVAARGATP